MLNGFGTVVNALGKRSKPYLPQICGTIKWRLNNKAAKIRQQAADLIARIAPVLKSCEEEQLLGHLGVVLYEYLGEEVSDGLEFYEWQLHVCVSYYSVPWQHVRTTGECMSAAQGFCIVQPGVHALALVARAACLVSDPVTPLPHVAVS